MRVSPNNSRPASIPRRCLRPWGHHARWGGPEVIGDELKPLSPAGARDRSRQWCSHSRCWVDLVRDEEGTFHVLEDNLRCPSGVSYVLENRRTLAHVAPEVFTGYRVAPVTEYPEQLYRALAAAAPRDVHDPTVVVLTPGVYNSAHFEHAFLARRMGAELVEGRDLFCRGGFVYMGPPRTSAGPRDLPPP